MPASKYRFRYLDRLEPEFVSSASLLVGSSIHAAIEHHHRRQLESEEPAVLDEMLEVFWDEWRCRMEESPEVRFGKNEDVASIDNLAKRMLSSFIDSDLAKAPGVVIGIEESLRSTVIDARPEFLGIVDLVFESGDALTIRDYKTVAIKVEPGHGGIIGRSVVPVRRNREGSRTGKESRGRVCGFDQD